MVTRTTRKIVDRSQATKYIAVAQSLRAAAEALSVLAEEGDRYGNAIGVVAVHAAIAYSDAVTIAYGSLKATGADHGRAADLVREVLGSRVDKDALKHLTYVLSVKDSYSYLGEYYRVHDARKVLDRMARFADWAQQMYDLRGA